MSDTLHSRTIRLAASMPKGSAEREALLDVLAHPKTATLLRDVVKDSILVGAKAAFVKSIQKWSPGATATFDIVSGGLQIRLWLPESFDEGDAREVATKALGRKVRVVQHSLTKGTFVALAVLTWADLK